MNNKEKRKYITDMLVFNSHLFLSEIETRRDFLKQTPTTLYKYRPFDKYAFDMIEKNYAFLAPVKGLDDPFDCLNDFNTDVFYNKETKRITPKAIDYIIKLVCPQGFGEMTPKEVKELAVKCVDENGIDYEKVPKKITGSEWSKKIRPEPLFVALNTFNENFLNILNESKLDGFAESAMYPSERVGVCSLSEKRDNKVMWSLYGKNYSGYCIEYEIPKQREVVLNLCPVIYTKKNNNRFMEKMLEYAISSMLRTITDGQQSGNIGAAMELFCTKDTDWSYQSEWRIVANAGAHFKFLRIKSIYLGFKVGKTNESKMKRSAKKFGFELFKMNKPNGSKKITYTKLI